MIRICKLLTTATSLTLSTYAFSVSSFNGFYAGAAGRMVANGRAYQCFCATASHILPNSGFSSSTTGQPTSITTSGVGKNLKDSGIGLLSFGYNHQSRIVSSFLWQLRLF